ncbi:hypothetical protein DB30_04657 [Enhygromyxa salina]|uniref:Uncharacterized protein n=2 Tax=Enhygromyxa salina TaxID=215803 RepID=A0A0C2DHQ9_9BACT|nr:hypothetical protein DB30_04657 [Enhygromyxa salina]
MTSTTALADLASPEPAPTPAPEVKAEVPAPEVTAEVPAPEVKAETAPDAKQDDAKKDDAKQDDAKKAGSCSMVDNDDRVIGLAGLMLLISGFALRRRRG